MLRYYLIISVCSARAALRGQRMNANLRTMLATSNDNIAFIGKYQRNNLGDKAVFQNVLGILELGYRMHRQGAFFKNSTEVVLWASYMSGESGPDWF